jgi:hypothetical protein
MSAELISSGPFDLLFFPDIKTESAVQGHLILQHAVNTTTCLSNTLTTDISHGCILKVSQTTIDTHYSNVFWTSVSTSENTVCLNCTAQAGDRPKKYVRLHVKFSLVLFDFIETTTLRNWYRQQMHNSTIYVFFQLLSSYMFRYCHHPQDAYTVISLKHTAKHNFQ